MKIKKWTTILLLILLSAQNIFAGGEAQNGGDAVVCYSDGQTISSVESHDIFESELQIEDFSIKLGNDKLSPKTKAKNALKQLKDLDPKRFADYTKRLDTMKFTYKDFELVDIKDSKHLRKIPEGCRLVQFAIHQWVKTKNIAEFVVQKTLWETADHNHRASLLLHEVIYEDFFLELQEQDSANVKRFVGLLISGKFEDMPIEDYCATLSSYGLSLLRDDVGLTHFKKKATHTWLEPNSLQINYLKLTGVHSTENVNPSGYHIHVKTANKFKLIKPVLPEGCYIDDLEFFIYPKNNLRSNGRVIVACDDEQASFLEKVGDNLEFESYKNQSIDKSHLLEVIRVRIR